MAALPGESPLAPEAAEAADVARAALRAVRRQCMNCAGNRREVRACPARGSCPLWHCRFGVRPQTYKAVRRRFLRRRRPCGFFKQRFVPGRLLSQTPGQHYFAQARPH